MNKGSSKRGGIHGADADGESGTECEYLSLMQKIHSIVFLWVCVTACAFFSASPEVFGTAGIAEWAISTPLGHEVNHTDPFKEQHGTSIRTRDTSESETPFVEKLQSWTFYLNYVVGQAEKGFFLLNETTKEVEYFKDETSQRRKMREIGLFNPISRPYTNEKGWMEAWTPTFLSPGALMTPPYEQLLRQEWFQKLSDAQKELHKKMLEQKAQADAKFLNEERDFYVKVEQKIEATPEFQRLTEPQKEKVKRYIEQRLTASAFAPN